MRLTPALAALTVAAIVAAIDTGALQNTLGEMQNTTLTVLQIFYKSIPVISVGLLALWALARRDIDTLMRSVWFYVIITAFVVWLILGLAARVSPEFAPLYQAVTGNGCPSFWCP